jgi:hypothetical protein
VNLGANNARTDFQPAPLGRFDHGHTGGDLRGHGLHYGLLSLAEINAVISKAYPGERIGGYQLSTLPDLFYQVALRRGLVFVNLCSGEILEAREGARIYRGRGILTTVVSSPGD